jgi:hypothetical protein
MSEALKRAMLERAVAMECCKFCQRGNNRHAEDCPRDEPGAAGRYEAGYTKGRRGGDPESRDLAYMAGFLRGEIAYESWYNGSEW